MHEETSSNFNNSLRQKLNNLSGSYKYTVYQKLFVWKREFKKKKKTEQTNRQTHKNRLRLRAWKGKKNKRKQD